MNLLVTASGELRCVYDEVLNLALIGQVHITRGSHVEPTTDGQWTADLSPVNGPRLGPFRNRTEALAAERDWLDTNWLTGGT